MKKNVMKNLEKIKSNRTIPLEIKKELSDKIISNFAMSTSFLILVLTYYIASFYITRDATELIYKISAGVFIVFTVIVFERAYKFDSGAKAVAGIELLAFSMFSLFAPFIFFTFEPQYLSMMILGMTFYYIIKILITYAIGKNKALKSNDDINVIIKKESQDDMAKNVHSTRRKKIEQVEEEEPKIRTVISAKRQRQAAARAKAQAVISSAKPKTKTAASRTRKLVEEDRNKTSEEIKPKKEPTKKSSATAKAKTTTKPKTTTKKAVTEKKATTKTSTAKTKTASTKTKKTPAKTKNDAIEKAEVESVSTKKTASKSTSTTKKATSSKAKKPATKGAAKTTKKTTTTKKATAAKVTTKDEKGTTRKRTTKKGEE